MSREGSIEAYILPSLQQIANGNLPYDSGNSNWGSVTTQTGRKGWEVGERFRREGTYIQLWLIHVNIWEKSNQYYKAVIFQLKINKLKKILNLPFKQVYYYPHCFDIRHGDVKCIPKDMQLVRGSARLGTNSGPCFLNHLTIQLSKTQRKQSQAKPPMTHCLKLPKILGHFFPLRSPSGPKCESVLPSPCHLFGFLFFSCQHNLYLSSHSG